MRLFAATTEPWQQLGNFAASLLNMDTVGDDSIEAIREKERMYEEAMRSGDYLDGRFWADTWCSAFVWKKTREFTYPITEEVFRRIERNPHACEPWMHGEIQRLAGEYRFFHWHLAFPDIFHMPPIAEDSRNHDTGWNGGFDIVLGNPPWERIKLQEKEWFSTKSDEVMNAPNAAARKKAIAKIRTEDPALYCEFRTAAREAEAESHLVRNGGRFRLCAQGDLNTYSLFAELFTQVLGSLGFGGIIVPTGIATDDSNSDFFGHLIEEKRFVSLFDFENRERVLFPEVYYRMRFCLLTVCGGGLAWEKPVFTFFALKVEDLNTPGQVFGLSKDDINLINPNSNTCPIFRSEHDAEIVRQIYRRVPILLREATDAAGNPWGITFARSFHMTNDADLFVSEDSLGETWNRDGNVFSREGEEYLLLYEGRMIDNYDHRLASTKLKDIKLQRSGESVTLTSAEKADPTCVVRPRYWVSAANIESASREMYRQGWVLGCMSITSATNARTCVVSVLPQAALGNSVIGLLSKADARHQCCLLANLCSLPFDYVCKQKVSGNNFNMFIIKQLPVLPPAAFDEGSPWESQTTLVEWIASRAIELAYTAHDLRKFACDAGYKGEPFRWDDDRRFLLRCELDAAFLHLFGIDREAAGHVIDAFTIVRSREEEQFGVYRTKRVILEIYDAMAEAERTGVSYQTRLDPPPADPRCCHPRKKVGILAFGSLINEPGPELNARIVMRIKTQTPFPVEYGRYSGRTRGGAPTLVPHSKGAPVQAEILVLDDGVSVSEARDMLWRRERRKIGSGETYVEGATPDSVVVRAHESPWVETLLYTDFNSSGKIAEPRPEDLAKHAVESIRSAKEGQDGISYLINAITEGIETPLTAEYVSEILKQTQANSISDALLKVKAPRPVQGIVNPTGGTRNSVARKQ